MKYINSYNTSAEYNQSEKFPLDVSYIKDDKSVQFNLRKVRETADYLRFEVISSRFSFSFSRSGIEYSPDFGTTWIELAANTESPQFKEGADEYNCSGLRFEIRCRKLSSWRVYSQNDGKKSQRTKISTFHYKL